MNATLAEMVRTFHAAFGVAVDQQMTPELKHLRTKLLREECEEAVDAIADGNLPAVAKELADVIVVAYGTAITFGIDLDAAVRAVHESNMTKLGSDGKPILRDDGKVLKGPGYREADVTAALPASFRPQPAGQHPRDEFCFHCAPDAMLLRGISLHDDGKPWDGPTVHMQVPESFCPAMTDDPEVSG